MISWPRKLWEMMEPRQKRSAMLMLALMVMGMVLETLSVGLVVPVLVFMSQDDAITRYPQLESLLAQLGYPTQSQLLAYIMLGLLIVYVLKTLFLAFVAWRQSRFVFGLQAGLSQRLFTGYLTQPYSFHLQRNSAQLIQTVISETTQYARGAILPGLTLLTEFFVLLGIGSLLFWVEPVGALVVALVLGVVGVSFHRFTSKRSMRWGTARQHHEGMRIQHLQQGLGGAKDVKLLGREQSFLKQYAQHNDSSARIWERQTTLQALPRLMLELLAMTGLVALVLIMLGQGKPIGELIPVLGLFAAAAFRLMPSVNRVLTSAQSLRFLQPVTNKLALELATFSSLEPVIEDAASINFKHELKLEQVGYAYQGAPLPALSDISLSIAVGTSVGFVGGSGAGKSTLIDVVLGLLTPTSGRITIDGSDIQQCLRGWMNRIGYVPQNIYLTDDSLRRNVAFGITADQIDDESVWRAIRSAQLEPFVNQLPEGLDTMVGERGIRLSGGQRQRIGIARALYHDPEVLVLDEATSSLDTATEQGVMEAVRALHGQKTILIVAHRLSTVEHCDTIIRLEQGKVIEQGKAAEVLKHQTSA